MVSGTFTAINMNANVKVSHKVNVCIICNAVLDNVFNIISVSCGAFSGRMKTPYSIVYISASFSKTLPT